MRATSRYMRVLWRTPHCRRTSSSSCLRSTGEGWADSFIGWCLLINSEPTLDKGGGASGEQSVLGLFARGATPHLAAARFITHSPVAPRAHTAGGAGQAMAGV